MNVNKLQERVLRDENGNKFNWTRQQRGKAFGLKPHDGTPIKRWVVLDKFGWWSVDGEQIDGVVWGKYHTAKEARTAVEIRLKLNKHRTVRNFICSRCGSAFHTRR